jgi:hypothetical protein
VTKTIKEKTVNIKYRDTKYLGSSFKISAVQNPNSGKNGAAFSCVEETVIFKGW